MFEVAQGSLGEDWYVNRNKYSCYFIIIVVVMSSGIQAVEPDYELERDMWSPKDCIS